ncbi:hypothetical protein H0H92_008711 [Tricholoma furcatifolium]|nr:hypothetical protein H0H92_008711 [Tricholoma furcatifolium]
MTRGNQRDQDRAKAQKKAAANAKKPKESATSLAKRKEQYGDLTGPSLKLLTYLYRDADALRAKQKKKEEELAAKATAGGGSGK